MENIYIFGHKNPDTDSITSAIALEYLKKQMGVNASAVTLGEVSRETKYALDYFGVKEPKYLNNVKLQIKDVDYHKNCFMHEKASIMDVYKYMEEKNITGVPIVADNNFFKGLITLKMLSKNLISGNYRKLKTSYENILNVLEAEEVLKFDEEIEGDILIAAYKSTTIITDFNLTKEHILIVGDRHSVIEKAVNEGVKLLILTGSSNIQEHHLKIAQENKVSIIRTNFDTFKTSNLIGLCNYASNLISDSKPYTFTQNDFYNDFVNVSNKLKHNNYPILDKDNTCLGLIRLTDITEKNKKKVILVDHNEGKQSVDGLDEAEILEIVDHHNIGSISTVNPINFRNMAVGCTCTVIYQLYLENNIEIPKHIAGLMLSGILSDTLRLTSPTTTELDKSTALALAQIAEVDYNDYGFEMLKAGTSLEGKTKEQIINGDIKAYNTDTETFAISQVFTLDYEKILQEKDEYLKIIEDIKEKNGYACVILAVTDILKNGSYVLFTTGIENELALGYNKEKFEQGTYVDGLVSRKKQIVSVIMNILNQ